MKTKTLFLIVLSIIPFICAISSVINAIDFYEDNQIGAVWVCALVFLCNIWCVCRLLEGIGE